MRTGAESWELGARSAMQKRYGQGRYIDPEVGLLEGEGAQQRIEADGGHPQRAPVPAWDRLSTERDSQAPVYYARPTVKEPVWIWSVPLYFQIGGVAGAAAVFTAALQVTGGEDFRGLRRSCRWIGAGGAALGSVLLIHDLGRPMRFLNMLRVVRPTSPMSLGSWVLAKAGGVLTLSLLAETATSLAPLGRAAGAAGGLLGIPLAGYTGVLLGNTAVPLWQQSRSVLPPLFIATGAAGLGDLLETLPLSRQERGIARRLGIAGTAAELAAILAVEKKSAGIPEVGAPLRHGKSGRMWRGGKFLVGASLGLSLLPIPGRWRHAVAALAGASGSLLLRFALFEAGKASSQDSQATFRQQKRLETRG